MSLQIIGSLLIFLSMIFGSYSVSAETKNKIHAEKKAPIENTNTILVLGDSLSAAYKIPVADGWVQLLQNHLAAKQHPIKVINASVSGDTTGQGLSRIKSLIAQHKPKLLILELGGNDGLRAINPKLIKKNLAKIISLAKSNNTQVLLLGIKILPNYGQRYTDKFHQIYPELAQQKFVTLVPFFMNGVAGNEEYMQADGIHPNSKAQPILLNNVLEHLNLEIFLEKEPAPKLNENN